MPAYSLFGRYLINPEGKKEAFLRTRLGYQSSDIILNSTEDFFNYRELESNNLLVAVGFQKNIFSKSSSSIYYGGDLVFQKRTENDFVIFSEKTQLPGYTNNNWNKYLLRSFVGIIGFNTKPIKYLNISFESGFFVGQTSSEYKYLAMFSNGDKGTNGINSSKSSNIGFRPFHQILFTLNLK